MPQGPQRYDNSPPQPRVAGKRHSSFLSAVGLFAGALASGCEAMSYETRLLRFDSFVGKRAVWSYKVAP